MAPRRGFSLLELLVVIAVTVVLTGLLMPAMKQIHENAHRVICLSNLQQLGEGFLMYGHDHNDFLPYSEILQAHNKPQDLMASRTSASKRWDGIGLLFAHNYCNQPYCFYCPSHHGEHPFERYATMWTDEFNIAQIYTNYHYAGHIAWDDQTKRRRTTDGHAVVLATDGLRTQSDFNHITGLNVLRADGSVRWREDGGKIFKTLPQTAEEPTPPEYSKLWGNIESEH